MVLALFVGCSFSYKNIEFQNGERAEKKKNFSAAVKHYSRVVKRAPDSALALKASQRAGQLALYQTKEFLKAVDFFKHIILYSPRAEDRKKAQEQVASIYFEKVNDYELSVTEYSKLLQITKNTQERFDYHFAVAKSYFYLKNFFQALVEVDLILKSELDQREKFDAQHFKANIYLTMKKPKEAIPIFRSLLSEYPDLAEKEKLSYSLVACYEDLKDYGTAIAELKKIMPTDPNPELVELKIKRLEEVRSNQPGARGLRK